MLAVPNITHLDTGWELTCRRWLDSPVPHACSTPEWLDASVPGHVHPDLVRHGVIADPFTRLAELGCPWVDDEDWCYRLEIDFSPDPALPRRLLRFEGLDTICTIFLDDERVAQHDNMFLPLEVDVTDRLTPGRHELRVQFEAATRVGRERRKHYLTQEGIRDDVQRFDGRAFVRKAQYMYGWDWGPRLVSAGIWRPVVLIEHDGRILDIHVWQRHLPDGSVELTPETRCDADGEVVHLIPGVAQLVRDGETVRLPNPKLWWPAGMGAAELLEVTTLLVPPAGSSRDALESSSLDRKRTRIGLRTLRLLQRPDRWGESFEFEVNGRRLWACGANWIPDHSFPSLVSRAQLSHRLTQARDLGMNMLRVWGGGVYESDDFYALCDECGLLVWQDFPYACSYYPDDAAAQSVAEREASQNVRRLRHHPSLALWCGNNENLTMTARPWGHRKEHPPRYHGEHLYDHVLPAVVRSLDPDRPYVPSSPAGGEDPNAGGIGDQHYWDVWHGRGDWRHYADSTARFVSEFGFASAPGIRTWRHMLPGAKDVLRLDPKHRIARWHDKTGKGYDRFLQLVELHYPAARDLEEWLYYSQLNQRDALRFGIEHYRRSEFCRGALLWQLNDCWPVQSWAVIDSAGDLKAAAYELRRLLAPLLLSLDLSEEQARLWIALENAHTPTHGEAELEARSLRDGRLLGAWTAEVRVEPEQRRVAVQAELGHLSRSETMLCGKFCGQTTWQFLSEPKSVQLAAPRLRGWWDGDGLVVESDAPLVDLMVWDEFDAVRWLDNFVTLPHPGHLLLRCVGRSSRLLARSLQGRHSIELLEPPDRVTWSRPLRSE